MPHSIRADTEVGGGEFQVARVPKDHGRDDEVQPRGAVGLVLERAVAQLAELAEKDGTRECVPGLALVQARLRAAAEPDRADYQRDLVVSLVRLSEIETRVNASNALSRALRIVEDLAASGRLAPADAWIMDELRKRLDDNGAEW